MDSLTDHSNSSIGHLNTHENVKMGEETISRGTITTDPLGSCVFFLLHFTVDEVPVCYLQHYSFIEHDESTCSPQETLEVILNGICEKMKGALRINSKLTNSNKSRLGSFQLLVGGGDAKEAERLKLAFSLLNQNENTTTKFWPKNEDTLFLYENLFNRVVVMKSVMKNLRTKEEATGKSFIEKYSFEKSLISIFLQVLELGKDWIFHGWKSNIVVYQKEDALCYVGHLLHEHLIFQQWISTSTQVHRQITSGTLIQQTLKIFYQ